MTSIVGTKGQIVIEKAIRDALDVRPGFIAVQRLVGDRVEIRFLEPEHDRSLRGALSALRRRSVSLEDWDQARDEAWRTTIAERSGEGTGGD